VSLGKKEGPIEASKAVIAESEVEYVESKKIHEAKPQDRHNKESNKITESKAHHVTKLKKKGLIHIVVVYHHPHHIEKQHS
jgi:hypothetical protein